MWNQYRAFYLFDTRLDQFVESESGVQFFSDLVEIVGPGIGYCERFANAIDAANYSQDLNVAKSLTDIAGFLQAQPRPSWSERLATGVQPLLARNIYSTNVWPECFVERLKDGGVYELILSLGARITEISAKMHFVSIPHSSLNRLRPSMARHIYEHRLRDDCSNIQ
jgi:hypothetical protein